MSSIFISKVLWLLAQPISMVLILLLLGLLLSFTRLRKTSRFSLLLASVLLFVSAFTNIGQVAIDPLENAFTRPSVPPENVAAIIVLGGGMDADVNSVRKGWELKRAGDRFVEGLRLAQLYPDAKIVVTGGVSVMAPGNEPESDAGIRFFVDLGIPASRIILEDAARNTEENAQLTRDLLPPANGGAYLLVTSAFHMPRSVGLFRKAGVDVVPWPADYLSTGQETFGPKLEQPAENLSNVSVAMREWVGLLAYWLMGRIETLVPRP